MAVTLATVCEPCGGLSQWKELSPPTQSFVVDFAECGYKVNWARDS